VTYRYAVPRTGETLWELHVVSGAVVATAAVLVAAPLPGTTARLVLVCAALALFAWLVPDALAALATAGVAYVLVNGFLLHRYGELSWDGADSLAQLGLLALTAVPALARSRVDAVREDRALAAELARLISEHGPSDDKSDTGREPGTESGSGGSAPGPKKENRG